MDKSPRKLQSPEVDESAVLLSPTLTVLHIKSIPAQTEDQLLSLSLFNTYPP